MSQRRKGVSLVDGRGKKEGSDLRQDSLGRRREKRGRGGRASITV